MTASNPCCEKCEKHVRDRQYIGRGQSRQYLVGVHIECKDHSCECHKETPAAVEKEYEEHSVDCDRDVSSGYISKHKGCIEKQQPEKEWWEEEFKQLYIKGDLKIDLSPFDLVSLKALKSFISRIAAQSEKKGREEIAGKVCEIIVGTDWDNDAESGFKRLVEATDMDAARSSEEGKTNNK